MREDVRLPEVIVDAIDVERDFDNVVPSSDGDAGASGPDEFPLVQIHEFLVGRGISTSAVWNGASATFASS
jgi:hypothetical protein